MQRLQLEPLGLKRVGQVHQVMTPVVGTMRPLVAARRLLDLEGSQEGPRVGKPP